MEFYSICTHRLPLLRTLKLAFDDVVIEHNCSIYTRELSGKMHVFANVTVAL